jgi:hypothetical protein
MRDGFRSLERMMAMDDRVWRRHANPWSGWTRMAALPLLALAVWSRVWIGGWAVLAVSLVLVWIWWNPRAFAEPRRLESWMTRGVLGERVFLEHRGDLPAGHVRAATLLGWLALPGVLLLAWGLWALWWEGVVFGTLLAMLPKLWFLDRMVWLHRDWVAAGRAVPGYADDEMKGGTDA